ncbi:SPOR domain-containing protein [Xylanibacter muris]|uniref:HU domain-containing protein n=1 Tax=Xylanibacter muris TaxID=2736290 RepID=UPI00255824A2|nr:SPOR domain-containing protein [Xylanibacter muris]
MIELDRHIEILLLDNDCVIVPGFGGFVAHHVDARYDFNDGTFLPPLRTIGFNPQLTMNDSLLAQSYVELYDISYPEAIRKIENEINELKQELYTEGSYELNDLGILSIDENGKYIFEPCEAGILTPALYGLSSFQMKRKEEAADACANKSIKDSKDIQSDAQVLFDNCVIHRDDENNYTETKENKNYENDVIRIKTSWIRNTAAAVAAIICFFLFTSPIANSTKDNVMTGNLHGNMFFNMIPEDSHTGDIKLTDVSSTVEKPEANNKDAKAANKETAKENKEDNFAAQETKKDKGKKETVYCIVMASRVAKANAETFVKKLHNEGYEQAYVHTNNNIIRVVYGHYTDESEASSELRSLRDNKYFEQSWIYKIQ